ncbi:molybdopterin molybdotransferase MoeA [Streptomyces sp. NPDC057638]|uniref:molybdopterin molybdotransferase MoeA n=1 Tax=Streptomyces sp. NPDC057638 TaxID=3346190 RepID=UPI0036843B25
MTRPGGPDPGGDGLEEALALVGPGARENAGARAAARERPRTRAPRHQGLSWPEAHERAVHAGRGAGGQSVDRVPLPGALRRVLAQPLTALGDLPSFDTSAMDGWAVAGPGPWHLGEGLSLLAGHSSASPLEDGTAVRIATGARVPVGATAVIRSEHARADERRRLLFAERTVIQGQDIRPRGQECRSGDRLLPAGFPVTPAVLGLAAAAGYDELDVVRRPRAEVLVLGDELLTEGPARDGLIRDALGPMTAPWLSALGVETLATRRLGDDQEALHQAVSGSTAELVVTTGGTAAGPVDHVHTVLRTLGAELLVDGVAVRPGHPMLLARLPATEGRPARYLVGLPGNPLAAVAGLLTLVEPLLRGLGGMRAPLPCRVPAQEEVPGHLHDTRLLPCVFRDGWMTPVRYAGPAMLRGVAAADGLAVIPPGGVRTGEELRVLEFPWRPMGGSAN